MTKKRLSSVLAVCGWLALGCGGQGTAQAGPAPGGKKVQAGTYVLTVDGPAAGKVGAQLAALIRVVPRGGYKINLEYPLKLQISGPAAANPRALTLAAKQAAKLSKAEILFRPAFKLAKAGEHAFKGTLRFSVCTEQQCEVKAENVEWVAKVVAAGP